MTEEIKTGEAIKMKISTKITWGHVLSAMTIIGSLITVYVSLETSIASLKTDNDNIKTSIATVQANQQNTYSAMSGQIDQVRADLRTLTAAILNKSAQNNVNYEVPKTNQGI